MAVPAYVVSFLFLASLLRCASISNPTLLESLTPKPSVRPLEGRVYLAIYESHPELENFQVDSLTHSNPSNSNSSCFIVCLSRTDKRIVVEVNISADRQIFSVRLVDLPATTTPPNEQNSNHKGESNELAAKKAEPSKGTTILSSNLTGGYSPRWPRYDDENIFLQSEFNGSLPKLGGFSPFTRYTDQRFKLALDFLTDQHPNLINYEIAEVHYQVVAGLNFLIRYTGLDKFTAIITKVNVDLKMQANLLHFNVYCQQRHGECEHLQARLVYSGVETVLRRHGELMDYDLIDLVVEEFNQDNLLFMTSFEHTELSLRAISHVKMQDGKDIAHSFYTYHYPA